MTPVPQCEVCCASPAHLLRPRDGSRVCRTCFYALFEDEVLETVRADGALRRGDRVAIGASGGKDSTVLIHVLDTLNRRHDLGLDLVLLSIDEGIRGYRDDSLETVHRNRDTYTLPLTVLSYRELYGWTMDEIVASIGPKSNCTFCGVFRRQALDRGAVRLGCSRIATGHNADDAAETVLMNLLRGDAARLARGTTGCGAAPGNGNAGDEEPVLGGLPRTKPLRMCYEKEIVLYARFKGLDYFSTECTYSKEAFRGGARGLVKDLERVRPSAILDIVRSGEMMRTATADSDVAAPRRSTAKLPEMRTCEQCGYMASQKLCKACVLLERLNAGRAKVAVEIEQEE